MALEKSIQLGRGFGDAVLFGLTRDETHALLGEPDEKDNSPIDGEEGELCGSEAWIYDELGVTVHFDEADDWRLGTIEVDSSEFALNGEKLMGCSPRDVQDRLESMNFGEMGEELFENEEEDDEPDCLLYYFEDVSLNIWFEEEECVEIQWGPFFENDAVCWPTK